MRPTVETEDAAALTPMLSATSANPSPSASGRSPLLVSSTIAVVMVRVEPRMFPPTTMMAPTSAIAPPKAAERRDEAGAAHGEKHGDRARSRGAVDAERIAVLGPEPFGQAMRKRDHDGTVSTVCAATIAAGVNRRPKAPRGPDRDTSR